MRVAIVFFQGKPQSRDKNLNIARALAEGIESNGHQTDIVDGDRDVNSKLTMYQYIVVGAAATTTFGGKIPENVSKFLSGAGIISGKRCFAYVVKGGMRITKTLAALMNVMEHEGMFLKYSEILTSPEEARAIGKRLHISQTE
jgi:flavodoxin